MSFSPLTQPANLPLSPPPPPSIQAIANNSSPIFTCHEMTVGSLFSISNNKNTLGQQANWKWVGLKGPGLLAVVLVIPYGRQAGEVGIITQPL